MRRVAKTTVFALLCAAAFLLNKKALYEGVSRDVPLFEEKLGGVFGFAIILAVLIVFYWRVDVYRQRHSDCSLSIPKKVLAALFAFFMIFKMSSFSPRCVCFAHCLRWDIVIFSVSCFARCMRRAQSLRALCAFPTPNVQA